MRSFPLKMMLRRLLRRRAYTAITVGGLAIGLVCCLFILVFVQHERSYDRLHTRADRIVRLTADLNTGGGTLDLAFVPAPWGPALAEDEAAVETAVRFARFAAPLLVRAGDRAFYEDHFFWADSTLFEVFDFRLLRGNPATALVAPYSVVLTEETARRYFGDADPMGRTLTIDETREYRVTGLLEQPPENLHFRFDFLASFTTLEDIYAGERGRFSWGYHFYYTYLLLADPAAAPRIEEGFLDFLERHTSERFAGYYERGHLTPLPSLYLRPARTNDVGPRGDPATLRLLVFLAVFILVLAAINFTNLAAAQGAERATEVGVRKALGASRGPLARALLAESLLLAAVAALAALALALALLPLFNTLAGTALGYDRLLSPGAVLLLLGTALATGTAGGLYPALVLSRPEPAHVLRPGGRAPRQGVRFRQGLVVFQFTVSIFLIALTAVVFSQIRHLLRAPLGFDAAPVLVVPMHDLTLRERYPVLKEAFLRHPNVQRVSASSTVPGALMERAAYRPEGLPDGETRTLPQLSADPDFVETLGLGLTAGRPLDTDRPTDAETAFLVNQALVDQMGWREPIGKRITWNAGRDPVEGRVVGVLADFHTTSLRDPVEPVVMHTVPQRFNFFTVRLGPGDVQQTLGALEDAWRTHQPGWPFDYRFLDADFAALYEAERRLGRLATAAALLALAVACLGLFGLAAYQAERRAREIGLRKALGATVPDVLRLLTREYLLLIAVAAVLAAPAAYLVAQGWLEDFAVRIDLLAHAWVFVAAGLAALLVALLTVGARALRAAHTDPARVLRYE